VVTVRTFTPPGRFGPTVESSFGIRNDLVSARSSRQPIPLNSMPAGKICDKIVLPNRTIEPHYNGQLLIRALFRLQMTGAIAQMKAFHAPVHPLPNLSIDN
jgi:hypothetical protein